MISFPQLSPYGPEDGRISPLSPQGSPCGSPASPTLASLQSSGGYYGSSPTGAGYLGMSPNTSPTATSHAGGFGLSQSYGEPPRKIFPEVAFEDLSASFKNLYKSVFDASQGGENFGKRCLKWNSLALTFFFNIKFNRQLLLLRHILHIFCGASRNVCRDWCISRFITPPKFLCQLNNMETLFTVLGY